MAVREEEVVATDESTLVAALAAAELEFEPLICDAINPHFGSRYVTLGALIAATRPALARHGLVLVQTVEPTEHWAELVTTLRHVSGESLSSRMPLPPWKGPQDAGSVLTYLRRYCSAGMLNIASEADDDANSAEHTQRAPRAPTGAAQGRVATKPAHKGQWPAKRVTGPIKQAATPAPAEVDAGQLADAIDNAHTLAALDALVPSLAALPTQDRPPLRQRFGTRRKALQDIAQDIAELDALTTGSTQP